MVIILFSQSILVMLTNMKCCHKLSLLLVKGVGRGIEANDGGQIMDDFTITDMHYLVVSLFCDLVRPLFQFIFTDVCSVIALFALFYKR